MAPGQRFRIKTDFGKQIWSKSVRIKLARHVVHKTLRIWVTLKSCAGLKWRDENLTMFQIWLLQVEMLWCAALPLRLHGRRGHLYSYVEMSYAFRGTEMLYTGICSWSRCFTPPISSQKELNFPWAPALTTSHHTRPLNFNATYIRIKNLKYCKRKWKY